MKQIVFAILGLGTLICLGIGVAQLAIRPQPVMPDSNPSQPGTIHGTLPSQSPGFDAATPRRRAVSPDAELTTHEMPLAEATGGQPDFNPAPTQSTVTAAPAVDPGFNQSIVTLLSREATFHQKQKVWKELKDAGRIDQTIGELEQTAASDPQSAAATTALGQAYWEKCTMLKDIREQAILIMKADQTFDAALNLDPDNWDARFTKALAMSYWPAELKRGDDVIGQFRALIELQESQSPQPEFAASYLRLGDQYEKAGDPERAAQVWHRGAALFPDNADLAKKIAAH